MPQHKNLANTSAKDSASRTADDTPIETPSLDEIDAVFAGLPEDAVVTVWRRQEDTAKWGVVDKFAHDMFSAEAVADKWGGGTYRAIATARVKDKPGRPRVASCQFVVDPAVRPRGTNGGAPAPAHNKLADVLEAAHIQALSSMMTTMQGVAEASRRPAADWSTIATALSPIIVALIERRADPLETAAKLVELTRPEGKPPEFSTLFDVFTRGLEFGADSRPDSLSRIADTVTQFVERTSATQEAQEGRKMLAQGETGVPPAPTSAGTAPPWLQLFKPFLPYLLKVASAGKNPILYAEWFVDQLDAAGLAVVNQLAAEPGYPENVVAMLPPQVLHLAPWFRDFCIDVAGQLEAEPDAPEPEAPEPEPARSRVTYARPPDHTEEDDAEDDDSD